MDNNKKTVIGMIHAPALPGTPMNTHSVDEICDYCVNEAKIYLECGVDALMIENMHDVPYLNSHVGPEIIATMTVLCREVKKMAGKKEVGIQILAAANKEALAVALASNLDFIRVEGFVFGHVADEGYIDGCAGELLRYRKHIGADHIKIFTDIKKKHSSHSITADVSIAETALAAAFFLSDGVIVTGSHTGAEPDVKEVMQVQNATKLPVIIGSGITHKNIATYFPIAEAFIVGSYFKKDGYWANPLDPERIKCLMESINQLKNNSGL